MKCQDIQFDLALYFDDILAPTEIECIDRHLAACPLCRDALAGHQAVRNELRSAERLNPSADIMANIRDAVRLAIAPPMFSPTFRLIDERRNWFDVWLMPSAVGSLATVIMSLALVWVILSPLKDREFALEKHGDTTTPMYVASTNSNIVDGIDLSPLEYANTRLSVAGESPSVNPEGALIAISRSLFRGEMKDDEVVIVADVFGNGLAQIAEIVEPSDDAERILELRKAFQTRADFAPFVPAAMDGRSDPVRVVLKIQNVNVRVDPQGL